MGLCLVQLASRLHLPSCQDDFPAKAYWTLSAFRKKIICCHGRVSTTFFETVALRRNLGSYFIHAHSCVPDELERSGLLYRNSSKPAGHPASTNRESDPASAADGKIRDIHPPAPPSPACRQEVVDRILRSQNRYDIPYVLGRRIRVQPFKHAGLNIFRVYHTSGANRPGQCVGCKNQFQRPHPRPACRV